MYAEGNQTNEFILRDYEKIYISKCSQHASPEG